MLLVLGADTFSPASAWPTQPCSAECQGLATPPVPQPVNPHTLLFLRWQRVLLIKMISRVSSERDQSSRDGSVIEEGVANLPGMPRREGEG